MTERERYAEWIPRTLLVLPRLYLGMIFAIGAYAKLTAPRGFSVALAGFLNSVALQNGYSWYRPLVQNFVLPHVQIFAILVLAGELLVALCMLSGFATRAAAIVAIVLLLNYASAKGLPLWSPASNDAADIVLAILVLAGAAGRSFGIDRVLHERRLRA